MFRLSSWSPRRLLLAWVVYWAALGLAAIAPALPAALKLTGADSHGSSSVSFGDAGLALSITANSVVQWSHTYPLWVMSLWIGVPPLMLWALWLRAQARSRRMEQDAAADGARVH